MEPLEFTFFSGGCALRGGIDLPADRRAAEEEPPLLVCSGFTGLKSIHPDRFARALAPRGHTCLGFDYRGFGPSEGPRGQVSLEQQTHDILQAVAAFRAHEAIGGRPLVLAGWGMGAALALQAARQLPASHLAGLACLNGFYDAARVQRALRGEAGWSAHLAWLEEQRRAALEDRDLRLDPFDVYPLDPVSRGYVDEVLRKNPDYDAEGIELSFATSLLGLKVDSQLEDLHPWPLFIAHGEENALHPPEEAKALLAAYRGPAEICWLEGAGHTEWMLDEHPTFQLLVERIDRWLKALPRAS